MRISDWSSDVCSSDLAGEVDRRQRGQLRHRSQLLEGEFRGPLGARGDPGQAVGAVDGHRRSEEHTSELQSLMRISYAVFCLKKKKYTTNHTQSQHNQNVKT